MTETQSLSKDIVALGEQLKKEAGGDLSNGFDVMFYPFVEKAVDILTHNILNLIEDKYNVSQK